MEKYNVKVGGRPVEVHQARVSALPLNKLFDGEQRPLEQTEIAYFVTVDIEQEERMEIQLSESFDTCELRPLSKNIGYERQGNTLFIPVKEAGQFTVEIDGFHHALHVFVNEKSIAPQDCTMYFKKGIHDVGLLWLESNQTIYLEEGAILNGVIYGKDVNNIKICGRGILNSACCRRGRDEHEGGQEIKNVLRSKGFDEDNINYLGSMVLQNCKNVFVEGITLVDSPLWTVIIRDNCEDVVVDNIKIIGQWRYNSDGVDICTSKNVILRNSFIRSFDDCIVVRGAHLPGEEGTTENVLVENCVCWNDWNIALEVWCGYKQSTIRNVVFKDNYIIHICSVVMDIKTWAGSTNTRMENITFDGIYVDADKEYRNCCVESRDRKGYIEDQNYTPDMIRMYVEVLGKPVGVGTQICDNTADSSEYRLLYRNIKFHKIKYSGKTLPSYIKPIQDILTIENVSFSECDFELLLNF